ncbi:MAG: hydroxymethylglutaryl-CoA lyase [Planctomycetes bacterium]|nr:hydroxymethylglutaryl-CoA lyase [Planctomycetota bacterium]
MPEYTRITDVSPRDGLQNEPGVISTADKVRLVQLLAMSGVDEIEVSSFVSPKWVPQLGDAAAVFEQLRNLPPSAPMLSALVPNERGLASALEVNQAAGRALIGKVSVFTAASETFSMRNTNATIAQAIERFVPVVRLAHGSGLLVRGYISCIVACPFEGAIAPDAVRRVADNLLQIGVDELDLGDTIGAGTPSNITEVIRAAPAGRLATTLHLHDTFGNAPACIRAALDAGIRSFDGSVAGLGGCPYASTPGRRAPGNIATGLLVRAVREAGYCCGVSDSALEQAAEHARRIVEGRGGLLTE